ncbi:MAG: hypothetical protein ACI94Y_002563 [Maribacter sp.]|jgi:hypothetical protein
MPLKNNFLHPKIDFFKISMLRKVLGVLVGFLYAFGFYALFYMTREIMRVIHISDDYDIIVFSEAELNYYNLFFAAIAVIFGQSMCFTFWLEKPRTLFSKNSKRRYSILNDQKVMNWYFMSWFSKLGLCLGLFLGMIFHFGGTLGFSIYSEYYYLPILIVIVLFLQSWNTIRRMYKKESIKWMLLSAVMVFVLSFALSKIDFVDYKSLNESILSKNPTHKYELDLVESETYERLNNKSLTLYMHIVSSNKNNLDTMPLFFLSYTNEILLKNIPFGIHGKRGSIEERLRDRVIMATHIDKKIKMKYVNQFKNKLYESDVRKIGFAVHLIDEYGERTLFTKYGFFSYRLPYYYPHLLYEEDWKSGLYESVEKIQLKYVDTSFYSINDTLITAQELKDKFKQIIIFENYVLEYYINDEMNFEAYIKVLIAYKTAIREVWNMDSHEVFNKKYDHLTSKEKRIIQSKYPYIIHEITEDMQKGIGPDLSNSQIPPGPPFPK